MQGVSLMSSIFPDCFPPEPPATDLSVGQDMLTHSNKATVEKVITQEHPGRVKYQGAYWPAKLYQVDGRIAVLPGEAVSVVAIQGITLFVIPITSSQ